MEEVKPLIRSGAKEFIDESEDLRDGGSWKELMLFARGKQHCCPLMSYVSSHFIFEISLSVMSHRTKAQSKLQSGAKDMWDS